MIATAFLSMWISNTASAIFMVSIAIPVITEFAMLAKKQHLGLDTSPGKFKFGMALMLGIGYAATIGGMGTIIGTVPNTIMMGTVKSVLGSEINFLEWRVIGMPIAVLGLFVSWLYLTKIAFPFGSQKFHEAEGFIKAGLKSLGNISLTEIKVMAKG